MKKPITVIMLPALALGLVACTQKSYETVTPASTAVEISAGVSTRASGDTWDAGDEIGVIVTSAPSSSSMAENYRNAEYTADSGGTSTDFSAAGTDIYFDASGSVTFTAYYPYQSGAVDSYPGTDGVITVSTADQSSDQTAIDFLYADARTASFSSPQVSFTFSHVMSRIIINLGGGNGLSAGAITDGAYALTGLVHDGGVCVFGTDAGVASATGTADGTAWSLNSCCQAVTAATGYDCAYCAILLPQELSSLEFSATVGKASFTVDLTQYTDVLEAGRSYTFNILISEEGLSVQESTITDWASTAAETSVDLK